MLPPELFPEALQPIIYFILLPLGLVFFAVVLPLIFWFVIMPAEARTYTRNRIGKKPFIDYETEDGTRHLETADIHPEGFLIGNKSQNIYLLPRPTQKRVIERMLEGKYTKAQVEKIYRTINDMEKRVLKAGIVKGLGVRIFRAYQSVGIASSLAQLVGLNYNGDSDKVYMAVPVVANTNKRVKAVELYLEEDKKLKEFFVKVQLPVFPSVLQKFFNHNYTQNQLIAVYRKGIQVGEARARNPLGKWLIPLLIIMAVVGVVVVVVAVAMG